MTPRLGLLVGVAGMDLRDGLAVAREAEDAGLGAVAVGEAAYDTFAAAAAVATVTRQVAVVSGVATWVRPPIATARAAATVDELSGGRYVLGLGTMPAAWNTRFYGLPADHPLDRMREYVAVVRAGLAAHSGRAAHVDGRYHRVDGYTRLAPPLREEVPVALAVTRPGMARLAGEIADGVAYNVVCTPGWIRERLAPAVALAGRRIERTALVRCIVDEQEARALDRARRSFALYRDVPYFAEVAAHAGGVGDDLYRELCLIGPPDACREQLLRYEGLVDRVDLAPAGGLDAAELRAQYAGLLEVAAGGVSRAGTPRGRVGR